MKMKLRINLRSIDIVRRFVDYTNELSFEAFVKSGRYTVDAKSVMGIFSLDLLEDLELILEPQTEEDSKKIVKFIDDITELGVVVGEE